VRWGSEWSVRWGRWEWHEVGVRYEGCGVDLG
jgi:hypothetical protein